MKEGSYINLNAEDRFVDSCLLRQAYIAYEETRAPGKPTFVQLPRDFELGIVSSKEPVIARAISSILSRSLEDAKASTGGYIPDSVVRRVQLEIISPFGVAHIWGEAGHRFVLSIPAGDNKREIVASILVGRSKDTIFFFTGRYNNLSHSTMASEVDLDMLDTDVPGQKWFDRFAFPDLKRFKPDRFHHIANFVVAKEHRASGCSRLLLNSIVQYYSRDYIDHYENPILHSQHLLCGLGFWQIGDPPWLPKMEKLGFRLRTGAESFFIEQDWALLSPVYEFGRLVENLEYNRRYGLFDRYRQDTSVRSSSDLDLVDRIPEVLALAQNPRAKLQYFQACFTFLENPPNPVSGRDSE